MSYLRIISILSLIISLSNLAEAQSKGWEAGGQIGTAHYFGDLNTRFDLSQPGSAIGVIVRNNFNDRLALRFTAAYAGVRADDARSNNPFEQARNLSFRSDIFEAGLGMEFNFFQYIHGSKDHFFTPYVVGGLNFFQFEPQALYNGEYVDLRPLGTEGQFRGEEYFNINAAVFYGGGFKISWNYEWAINIEIGGRRTFTDYLDDVSTVYPDKSDVEQLRGDVAVALSDRSIILPNVNEEGLLGSEGRQRGNAETKDHYLFTGIGVVYYFGDLDCPW